jgi:hypothetical protein
MISMRIATFGPISGGLKKPFLEHSVKHKPVAHVVTSRDTCPVPSLFSTCYLLRLSLWRLETSGGHTRRNGLREADLSP